MLILFDVDATLITTSRTGIAAMGDAGRSLFGPQFDENRVQYAGRLDPLIIADLLAVHGQDASTAAIEAFRRAYRDHLERLLSSRPGVARPCPGVRTLLERLRAARADTAGIAPALGLLTGNFPETGSIKLRAAGLDPGLFQVQVWGCDSPHSPPARDHLPPVAMERYRRCIGGALSPRQVVIVGDTPHDVACARAHGCRSLGVATGSYSVAQLRDAGADLTLTDLSATEDVVQWLIKTSP